MTTQTKIQLFQKEILKAGQTIKISEDFDMGYKHLEGIAVLSTIGAGHIFRNFTIAGTEVFPKNFEAEFLQSNNSVSPNDRFFRVKELADGRKVEIEFIDSGKAGSYPYNLKVYMLLTQ